jgi:ligand-binding sensor domain-containing protein/two-component sensor histidine kinase
VYRADPHDPKTLPVNVVSSICEARDGGYLWIGTESAGLVRFNLRTGLCQRYQSEDEDRDYNVIRDVYEDGDGTLWVAASDGLFALRFSSDSIQSVRKYVVESPESPFAWKNNVFVIHKDKFDQLLFGTWGGLYCFDRQRGILARPNGVQNLDSISTMSEDAEGNLWIGTMHRGIFRVDAARSKATRVVDNGMVFASLAVDSVTMWFSTESGGLFAVDSRTNRRTDVALGDAIPSSARAHAMYKDRVGTIWLGMRDDGVIKLTAPTQQFTTYRSLGDTPAEANTIWSLHQLRTGAIWVGTSNGVKILDRRSRQLLDYPLVHLKGHQVRAILEDGDAVWFGTLPDGFWKWERRTNRWKHFVHTPNNPNSIQSINVYALHKDRNGILWIGSNDGGLTRLDPVTETFKNYRMKYYWVTSILEDRAGILWLGTWNSGLCRFDPVAETFEYITLLQTDPKYVAANSTLMIHGSSAESHILWLGTNGSGLVRFDTRTKRMTTYTTKDGLPNDFIYGILEDTLGNLWLSTNVGISQFNPRLNAFKNYTVDDGLQGNQFNLGASLVSANGEFFFGGQFGLNGFVPSYALNPHPPQVWITSISVSGQPIAFDEPDSKRGILTLPHDARDVTFQFVGLHYGDASKNKYVYRMDGLDSNWIEVKSERKVVFPQLLPGDYVFNVKAANCDGVWSEPIHVRVRIAHPYWTAWWFYVLIAGFGGITALLFLRFSHRLARKVKTKMRKDFGDNVHDDITPHLSIISDDATKLEELLKDASPEARSLVRKLVGNLHIASREIDHLTGQFSPGKESLYELAVGLKDFSDHLFDDANVAFELKGVSEDFEHVTLPLEWRLNILRIFKEAMHNVLKHAKESSHVVLSFALTHRCLCIELADDGNGFDESTLKRVNGLGHMRARACELGGRVEIISGNGGGTKVRFTAKLP